MASFLFSTYGARGDLLPYIAIGQELARRGHRATIGTAEGYRTTVLDAGLEFRAIRPDNPVGEDARHMMAPKDGTEYLFRRLLLPALAETVADLRAATREADVLVTHTTNLAGPIVAALEAPRGLKWASGVVSPLALFSLADPPALPVAPLLAEKRPAVNRLLIKLLKRQFGMFLKPVQAFRVGAGLPRGENALFEDAHSPELALGLFSPALAPPQPDWPKSMRATGFCFVNSNAELPEKVQRFVEAGKPPIVFVLASYFHGADAWRQAGLEALENLASLNERGLFLGYPEAETERSLSLPFAPLDAVLPHAGALVHHGGIGTLALGLRHGVPMVLTPSAHDQPDTARLAKRARVAEILPPQLFYADLLASKLNVLMGDSAAYERLASWRERIAEENGAVTAADALEDLIR